MLKKLVNGITEREIETSVTLDYRADRWGIERIVLDTVSNHLPHDSRGKEIKVLLKQNGKYVDMKEASDTVKTEEIVFEDDGAGYDVDMLSVLYSTKSADALSVGQFGEGAKLVAGACLRNGFGLEYESKNWRAVPFSREVTIGDAKVKKLCFKVEENGHRRKGSRTVINNPSSDLVKEVLKLPEKVLLFNDDVKELERSYSDRVIKTGQKNALFVKGVRIKDLDSLFSYDLNMTDITPDRHFVNDDGVQGRIRDLLRNCQNKEVRKQILMMSHVNPDQFYYEYSALDGKIGSEEKIYGAFDKSSHESDNEKYIKNLITNYIPKSKFELDFWKQTFIELFGKDAVLASNDPTKNEDAKIMGYNPIKLHYAVANYLNARGVQLASDLHVQQEYKWMNLEDLTEAERSTLALKDEVNHVLGIKTPVEVKVYSGLFTSTGREIPESRGVHCKEIANRRNGDEKKGLHTYIGVKRDELKDPARFIEVYIHELGHHVTDAGDYDRKFTEFFVRSLARFVASGIALKMYESIVPEGKEISMAAYLKSDNLNGRNL